MNRRRDEGGISARREEFRMSGGIAWPPPQRRMSAGRIVNPGNLLPEPRISAGRLVNPGYLYPGATLSGWVGSPGAVSIDYANAYHFGALGRRY